jgi:hypothetical protein
MGAKPHSRLSSLSLLPSLPNLFPGAHDNPSELHSSNLNCLNIRPSNLFLENQPGDFERCFFWSQVICREGFTAKCLKTRDCFISKAIWFKCSVIGCTAFHWIEIVILFFTALMALNQTGQMASWKLLVLHWGFNQKDIWIPSQVCSIRFLEADLDISTFLRCSMWF